MVWKNDFQKRIKKFENSFKVPLNNHSISIKIRNIGPGCFGRNCCPNAYQIIDAKLALLENEKNFYFIEHETGPEIIVYVALTSAGLSLASSIINLITTIIKARFEGQKKGDSHKNPVEIIVRKINKNNKFSEVKVLLIDSPKKYSDNDIKAEIIQAINELFKNKK